jgi:viroplasmin and RNaseH domain-containing protein
MNLQLMEDQVIGFSNNNYGGYDTFEEAQEEY